MEELIGQQLAKQAGKQCWLRLEIVFLLYIITRIVLLQHSMLMTRYTNSRIDCRCQTKTEALSILISSRGKNGGFITTTTHTHRRRRRCQQ